MARLFNNNTANYMSRSGVNFGLNGLTECSLAVWVKLTAATADNQRFTDKQYSTATAGCPFRMQYLQGTGELAASVNNGAGQSPDWTCSWTPGFGTWTRALFTYKRNAITSADGLLYLNGVAQTISTFTANGYAAGFTIAEDSNNYFLGLRVLTNLLPLNGALDWSCIWNRQLTAQEALLDYTNPRNVTNGLISRVRLGGTDPDDAFGGSMTMNGTLLDVSGNVPIRAAMPSPYATRVRPRPFAPGLAR